MRGIDALIRIWAIKQQTKIENTNRMYSIINDIVNKGYLSQDNLDQCIQVITEIEGPKEN